jgi:hypothetical protein
MPDKPGPRVKRSPGHRPQRPLLFFVGSTFTQLCPGFGVGGRVCPFGIVISGPPPFGRYCPDDGAG